MFLVLTEFSVFTVLGITRHDNMDLDSVPNHNISSILLKIGKMLSDYKPGICYLLKIDQLYTAVTYLNRGWKLILLGLVQAEPMARYLAMLAIQKAIATLKKTLFEMETLSVITIILIIKEIIHALNDIVDSDERRDNREKAVYILGQIGLVVGDVSEYADVLFLVNLKSDI